jgi:hypothetical protein
MASADHRVVVITGATAGVGRAVAPSFARRRWNVALIARDHDGLESTRREVEHAGGMALIISTDVADAEAVFAAADRVVRECQAIDVWINSAMATIFAPVWKISPVEFRRATQCHDCSRHGGDGNAGHCCLRRARWSCSISADCPMRTASELEQCSNAARRAVRLEQDFIAGGHQAATRGLRPRSRRKSSRSQRTRRGNGTRA